MFNLCNFELQQLVITLYLSEKKHAYWHTGISFGMPDASHHDHGLDAEVKHGNKDNFPVTRV